MEDFSLQEERSHCLQEVHEDTLENLEVKINEIKIKAFQESESVDGQRWNMSAVKQGQSEHKEEGKQRLKCENRRRG